MLTVLELANEDTKLRKESRREQAGPCPDPSCRCQTDGFRVKWNGERWVFMCRGCWDSEEWISDKNRKRGWGDAIDYLRHYRHMKFREAKALVGEDESMGEKEPLPLYPDDPRVRWPATVAYCEQALWTAEGASALDHLHSRGLEDEIARDAHIGYSCHGSIPRLIIPSINEGRYVAIYRRDLRPDCPYEERWKDAPGSTKDEFYLADCLRRKLPTVVVESAIDALSVLQEYGGASLNVVATGGTKGARTIASLAALALQPLVLIAFDADPKGDESALHWLKRLANARRLRPILKDVNDMLVQGWDICEWIDREIDVEPATACAACGTPVYMTDREFFFVPARNGSATCYCTKCKKQPAQEAL